MHKIPSLFVRDFGGNRSLVLPELTPGCEWVLNDEGIATRKRDGTATMIGAGGCLWRRYDVKNGKNPPDGFWPAQEPDPKTGHWPGWLLVGDGPEDKWYYTAPRPTEPGTYEFCGPKIQANPEGLEKHVFFRHGSELLEAPGLRVLSVDRAFEVLKAAFEHLPAEGIVWHHHDGRMVKLKRHDFGFRWPLESVGTR